MRVKNWDYRELRERIADGVTLRQFTDFYCDPVLDAWPSHAGALLWQQGSQILQHTRPIRMQGIGGRVPGP
jgi:hypothetical protein